MTKTSPDLQAKNTQSLYRLNKKCRLCGSSKLIEYLDLGFTPPADQFRTKDELNLPEIWYPLKVQLCQQCGLSQLSHVVNPQILYQHDYPYESSTTKTGQRHWQEFAEMVIKRVNLPKKSLIVDIGSNVGTLLSFFRDYGMNVLGVDPAPNIVKIANSKFKIRTICDFFNLRVAKEIKQKYNGADVITGTNVFAHIDDLHHLMLAVKKLLKDDGVFIFESPHIKNLIKNLEYDTIYHEHLSYLSLKPLIPFLKKFNLEIFAVEETAIHGGSFRVYIDLRGRRPIDTSVKKLLKEEQKLQLQELKTLRQFANKVYNNRRELNKLIENLLSKGKSIVAVSAPAKGMTLLNFCGLTNRQLKYVSEKTSLKIGRYTPGGHIPIVSDEDFLKDQPDYALLLAWNFSKEIMKNLNNFSKRGGKFIIPIPKPKII